MQSIDYGKIIKRSWELTWKNKWLWVMGMVLAVFAGGGSSGSSSSNSSKLNVPNASPSPAPTNLQGFHNQAINVLGEATNVLKTWFMNVPAGNWILLIVLILLFAIFSTVVVWILTAWAKGALISGLDDADMDKEVNLKTVSPKGISKIKDLIIFNLISVGISIAMVVGILLIIGIGFLIQLAVPVLGIIWMVLFGIVGSLAFLIALVLFAVLTIYAERLIVLENYSPWNAWKKGLSFGKGNFIPTFTMGIINSLIGCTSGCVGLIVIILILAIPGYILIAPIFKGGFHFPNIGQIIGIVVLFLLFITINLLIKAIFVVFDYSNWNLLFKELYKEGNNE